jgi:hypothetical protein
LQWRLLVGAVGTRQQRAASLRQKVGPLPAERLGQAAGFVATPPARRRGGCLLPAALLPADLLPLLLRFCATIHGGLLLLAGPLS